MKENAIVIRFLDVIKVEVDFSDFDSIYAAVGADRVSTIHTAKTQELSAKLGIHLMGYVDRDGDDINNKLACEISGYDYLGSFMFLCKTDNKFNPLPFTEAELNSVYTYLTTGKIIPASACKNDDSGNFFKKYGIAPYLPDFPVAPTYRFFDEYPTIILITYDFKGLSDAELGECGKALFPYSDILVTKFKNIGGGVNVDSGRTYYINNKYTPDAYYILIQAMENKRTEPLIMDIDSFIANQEDGKKNDDALSKANPSNEYNGASTINQSSADEDEVDDEEEGGIGFVPDLMVGYYIKVEIEAKWPNLEHTRVKYVRAYPLLQATEEDPQDQPYFSYFKNLIKVLEFDYFGENTIISLNLDKKRKVNLELDQPVTFDFDYTPNKPSSRRVGKITLTYKYHEVNDFVTVDGRISIKEFIINQETNKIVEKNKEIITNVSNEDDAEDQIVESDFTGTRYFPWLICEEDGFVLLYSSFDDYDDPDIRRKVYIPLYFDEPNISEDCFMSQDGEALNIKTEIVFED